MRSLTVVAVVLIAQACNGSTNLKEASPLKSYSSESNKVEAVETETKAPEPPPQGNTSADAIAPQEPSKEISQPSIEAPKDLPKAPIANEEVSVVPPTMISGTYLKCSTLLKPTAGAPNATVGCNIIDSTDKRVNVALFGGVVSFTAPSLIDSTNVLLRVPSSRKAAYDVYADLRARSLSSVNAALNNLLIRATIRDAVSGVIWKDMSEKSEGPSTTGKVGWATNCDNVGCEYFDGNTGLTWSIVGRSTGSAAPTLCANHTTLSDTTPYRVPTLNELLLARENDIAQADNGQALVNYQSNYFWALDGADFSQYYGLIMTNTSAPVSINPQTPGPLMCARDK